MLTAVVVRPALHKAVEELRCRLSLRHRLGGLNRPDRRQAWRIELLPVRIGEAGDQRVRGAQRALDLVEARVSLWRGLGPVVAPRGAVDREGQPEVLSRTGFQTCASQ